MNKGRIR